MSSCKCGETMQCPNCDHVEDSPRVNDRELSRLRVGYGPISSEGANSLIDDLIDERAKTKRLRVEKARIDLIESENCELSPPPVKGYPWVLTARGRQYDWEQFQGSTLRITLDEALKKLKTRG